MRTGVSVHMRRCTLVYMSSEGEITIVKNDLWVSLQLQPVNLLLLYLITAINEGLDQDLTSQLT